MAFYFHPSLYIDSLYAGIYRLAQLQDWPVRWPLQDDSRLLIGYSVSQTIEVIRLRVAVNLPEDPQTDHSPMTPTNLFCQIEHRLPNTQPLTLIDVIPTQC